MNPFVPVELIFVLAIIFAVFLLITALIWNSYPEWFIYILRAVIGGSILACAVICNLNLLVKKRC